MQNENHNFKSRPIVAEPYKVKNLGTIKCGNQEYGVPMKRKRRRKLSRKQKQKLFFRYFKALIFLFGILSAMFLLFQAGKTTYNYLYTYPELDRLAESILNSPINSKKDIDISDPFQVEMEIRRLAHDNNFKWSDYLVALAKCESSLDPTSEQSIGNVKGVDRGVFQINDYFHAEVSDEVAYDLKLATEWTMWRINNGFQYEWTCDKLISK